VTSRSRRVQLRLLVCCLLAYGLLVLTLEWQSIWWDEGISLDLAGLPWREIVRDRATNIHPPLYFFLLKMWTSLVGRTPFTGRYLSVLATTLLPAAAYRFLGRRLGRRAGRAAAFLVACAPPFIVYGQETRAYALVGLGVLALWGLAWPALTAGSPRRHAVSGRRLLWVEGSVVQGSPDSSLALWRGVLLGLTQVAVVGMHYAGAIAVAVTAAGYAIRWWRARQSGMARAVLLEWATGAGVSLLLASPWLATLVAVGLGGLASQAGIGNAFSEPVPAGYVGSMLGIFHTAGLPAALGSRDLVRVSRAVRNALPLTTLLGLLVSRRKRALAGLLLLWLVPFCAAVAIWTWSPQAHPRYLFAFILGGWMVVAALSVQPRVPIVFRGCLLVSVLASSVLGLRAYLTDPALARSDVRGVAAYVRERAQPGDVVLVPATDPSLEQYDLGAAEVLRAPSDPALLARAMAGDGVERSVYALDYRRGALDPQGALRAALAAGGGLAARESFHGVLLERWEMHSPPMAPVCSAAAPVCVAGQGLCLVGVSLQPHPLSGGALPVALCWAYDGPTPGGPSPRLSVTLRLHAPSDDVVSLHDDLLVDAGLRPADLWPKQNLVTYHLLPVPVGAMPVPHSVAMGLYDPTGQVGHVTLAVADGKPVSSVRIGEVEPATEPWLETTLYDARSLPDGPHVMLSGGVRLEGLRVEDAGVNPGRTVRMTAGWRTSGNVGEVPAFELRVDNDVLAVVTSTVRLGEVPAGRPLLETISLPVPATAPGGRGEIVVVSGAVHAAVGTVQVLGEVHVYDVPDMGFVVEAGAGGVATLLGGDLMPDDSVDAGGAVTLTLVWRAGSEAAGSDLKIFTHLVSEAGEIVAQHDGVPADWARPTTGWLPGEVIVDPHVLAWQPGAATTITSGERLHLRVGLYDGATGVRVIWDHGDDYFELGPGLTVADAADP